MTITVINKELHYSYIQPVPNAAGGQTNLKKRGTANQMGNGLDTREKVEKPFSFYLNQKTQKG
ncbi:Hypothetical protein LUCI_4436 [Lucifera butyrica]|uniref:Uncharacterized protein n=1 Tax=Lucifera butyrica TaxID=1351585 RepID=A0A498REA4_9FIRM|nr:hypothetical protein [Lucifera butyrica]VBB09150.1 Hypothetical protein LUCI_4436 [Lucifera butyrica]